MGLGPDWTGLILVLSGFEFWDRTVGYGCESGNHNSERFRAYERYS